MDSPTGLTLTDNYGQSHKIEGVSARIGCAPQSDILIDEPGILDNHAQIKLERNDWVLYDKVAGGSHISINGREIQGLSKLHDGDVISIGSAILRVSIPDSQPVSASFLPETPVQESATVDFSAFRSTGEYSVQVQPEPEETVAKKKCRACGQLIHLEAEICPLCGVRQMQAPLPPMPKVATKSKGTAAVLGIFLGSFGAHKFYLGQPGSGLLYFLFCWTWLPGIIGFFEGLSYLGLSEEKFTEKYG